MEYHLIHFDPNTRELYSGSNIGKEIYDEYSELHIVLIKYYRSFSLIKFPNLAFENFEKGFQETVELMKKHDFNREHFMNLTFIVEFHLINYLTNLRLYLDHTEKRLKNDYSDDELFELFKKITSSFYDDTFAYPFVYKLRNFVQHCSLPFTPEKKDSLREGTTELETSTASIFFDRDALLNEFDGWSEIVKSKIKEQPERIEIVHTIQESMSSLNEIERILKDCEKEILKPIAERVMEICKPVLDNNGNPCIAKLTPSKEKNSGFHYSMMNFPFGVLISMGYEFDQIKKSSLLNLT